MIFNSLTFVVFFAIVLAFYNLPMPWTAKKIGLPYSPSMITDRDTNLRLGNAYLKLVLDDVGGSQAMAAAAYNAGPGRPRKWREGPVLEPAVWAETIPFNETRDPNAPPADKELP